MAAVPCLIEALEKLEVSQRFKATIVGAYLAPEGKTEVEHECVDRVHTDSRELGRLCGLMVLHGATTRRRRARRKTVLKLRHPTQALHKTQKAEVSDSEQELRFERAH